VRAKGKFLAGRKPRWWRCWPSMDQPHAGRALRGAASSDTAVWIELVLRLSRPERGGPGNRLGRCVARKAVTAVGFSFPVLAAGFRAGLTKIIWRWSWRPGRGPDPAYWRGIRREGQRLEVRGYQPCWLSRWRPGSRRTFAAGSRCACRQSLARAVRFGALSWACSGASLRPDSSYGTCAKRSGR
jgi:hypothetical protein